MANPYSPRLEDEEIPQSELIFGRTPALRVLRSRLDAAAAVNTAVLIQGENGTGKEMLARLLHQRSPGRRGPFVKINCPAIPHGLIESELFGYERGAFTGAVRSKPGLFEAANQGTLFLDEIGELDAGVQAKLLHALQDYRYFRVGGEIEMRMTARMITATNRDLEESIEAGTFRRDLFYRINAICFTLPPLRERREDIPMLVEHFRQKHNRALHRAAPPLELALLRRMEEHSWPGNIRELENVMRRYVIFGQPEVVLEELGGVGRAVPLPHLPRGSGAMPLKKLTREVTRELERKLILQVLEENQWSRKKAAAILKISYRALLYKIRASGIPSRGSRLAAREKPET